MSYAMITGVQKIRLSGAEKRMFARWSKLYAEQLRVAYNPPIFLRANYAFGAIISLGGMLLMYYLAVRSQVGIADYYAFNTAYGMVSGAFMSIAGIATTVAQFKPTIEMAKPIMDTIPEISEDKPVIERLLGGIEISNASFRYNDGMPNVIDDLSLKIPQDISLFTDNGWNFPDNFKDLDTTISNGNLKSTYLEKGDNWFLVEIFNYSGDDKTVKDCPIGRITYDFSGDMQIYIAGDYLLNDKTLDAFIKDFGEPMSQADYSTYTEIIYDKNEQEGIYDRYTLRFDKETKIINSFDVVNFY
jgi:hypothetical protein